MKTTTNGAKQSRGLSLVRRVLTILLLAGSLGAGRAEDLFSLTAIGTGSTNTVGSKSLLSLVEQVINGTGQFNYFQANDLLLGTLRYAGVNDAIRFTNNAAGTSARIIIPSTGLNRQFTGGTRAQVEDQIEQFLKTEGSAEVAKFLKAMAAQSLVAVTDGNPNSTTAFSAAQTYGNYGMDFAETNEEKDSPKESAGRGGFGIIADVGTFDANGIKGTTYSLPLYARFKLTERVGLNFDLPVNYVDIEGAQVFGLGLGLGLPIKVVPRAKGSPWHWQLTPFGGASASGSQDFVAGGLLVNGGANSMLAYDFGRCTLSMGNHFSLYEGVPLTIDTYTFDPGVSQQILKNGLKLDVPLGRRWVFDVYGIHTKFLASAAIDQYVTVGGEIGYRLLGKADAAKKKSGYLKFGVYAELGKNFTSAHAQFGTGWKF